jgi:mannose-6-phosphate isomerase-like protein (cupin superfamily)/very-short-patch-repair endonuclease
MRRLSQEEFINKAKMAHNNYYDYSNTKFKTCRDKVDIICPKHGLFGQVASSHLRGAGCAECGKGKISQSRKYNTEDFIRAANKIHGHKYNYSLMDYISFKSKVTILCKKHGTFKQTPESHLKRNGCPTCGKLSRIEKRALSLQEFVFKASKVHKNKYDYSKTKYQNNKTKVSIRCCEHGPFNQRPADHLCGYGCPSCGSEKRALKHEKMVADFFKHEGLDFLKIQLKLKKKNNKLVRCYPDFYIPKYNMIVEYNGAQHYKPVLCFAKNKLDADKKFAKQQRRDQRLRDFCNNQKIELLEIDGRKYTNIKLIKYLQKMFQIKADQYSNFIEKPWGSETILEVNKHYTMKKLFMKENHHCSVQSHLYKHETIYVLSGELNLYIGDSIDELQVKTCCSGESFVIPPGIIHRMEGKTNATYLESSTSYLFDVVRFIDSYGRGTEA